jgi:hypothetical protein
LCYNILEESTNNLLHLRNEFVDFIMNDRITDEEKNNKIMWMLFSFIIVSDICCIAKIIENPHIIFCYQYEDCGIARWNPIADCIDENSVQFRHELELKNPIIDLQVDLVTRGK